MIYLSTERLILRQWQDTDYPLFAAINADPKVMEFFPNTLTSAESNDGVNRVRAHIDQHGYGFWAVERSDTGEFIGFIGLKYNPDGLPFAPCVEIGWRLGAAHWGQGFATEGARSSLKFAFTEQNLSRVISMTPTTNKVSENVMQKLGMRNTGNNFNHPQVDSGHVLEPHVLYQITREEWVSQHQPSTS